jgi:hypothetical protein
MAGLVRVGWPGGIAPPGHPTRERTEARRPQRCASAIRPKHERRARLASVMLSLRIRQRCPRTSRALPHSVGATQWTRLMLLDQRSSVRAAAQSATKQEHALVALAANPLTRTRAWPTGRSKFQTGRHLWGLWLGLAGHRAAPRRPSARPVHGPAGACRETVAAMHGMTKQKARFVSS